MKRLSDEELTELERIVRRDDDLPNPRWVLSVLAELRAYRAVLTADAMHTLSGIRAVVNMNYPGSLKPAAVAVLDQLLALHCEAQKPEGGDGE